MSNSSTPTGCWTKCLWCITTCGGKRIFRVSPSDPFPVVSAKGKKGDVLPETQNKASKPKSEAIPVTKSGSEFGYTNPYFLSDINPNGPDSNGDQLDSANPEDQARNDPVRRVPVEELKDVHLQNSIFIEIGKERRLRVVHLQKVTPVETQASTSSTENCSNFFREPSPVQDIKKPEEDDEDEYWFSKWTRKPRFRSIFEKNTIHGQSVEDDDEVENNNTVDGDSGALSKDFEAARAAAAAKRRAWAYNNESLDNVVQQSTVVETEEEEFNSIDICDSVRTRWTKCRNDNKSPGGEESSSPSSESRVKMQEVDMGVPNHIETSKKDKPLPKSENGFTNLGFEDNEEHPSETDIVKPVAKSSSQDSDTSLSSSPTKLRTVGIVGEDILTVIPLDDPEPVQITTGGSVLLPLIFFIHGISGSSEVWKSQMDFFHNLGYEIIAPDLLGHGYSSTPYNAKYYYFESLAQDLLSIFDYFVEEGRKVVLIGHGYGACLASVITRVRPKSSCLLISIAGGGPTPLISRTCCRSSIVPFYCKFFHTNRKKGRFDNPELRHVLPPVIYEHMLIGQVWNDGDSAFYRRITVPTLLVYGMKDKVVNLVEECEMERTIPKSFLEIIDTAGHMVMFDDPTKLNKMVGKFIQSWS